MPPPGMARVLGVEILCGGVDRALMGSWYSSRSRHMATQIIIINSARVKAKYGNKSEVKKPGSFRLQFPFDSDSPRKLRTSSRLHLAT